MNAGKIGRVGTQEKIIYDVMVEFSKPRLSCSIIAEWVQILSKQLLCCSVTVLQTRLLFPEILSGVVFLDDQR